MPVAPHPAPPRHLYASIADKLRHSIETRQIKPGFNLPSERGLAEYHAVTRQTVRAAVDQLQSAGLVTRDRLGTYVLGIDAGPGLGLRGGPTEGHDFPGLLLRTPVVRSTGLLTEAGRDAGEDAGHESLVYRHWVYCRGGCVGQRSVSSFHRRLVELVPPLAEAVERVRGDEQVASIRPRGVDPRLGSVLGWLQTHFPDARQTDRVQALPHPVRHAAPRDPRPAAHVHVERTISNPDGLVLLRTVFRIFDDQALLTSQPATTTYGRGAGTPGRSQARLPGVHLGTHDRVALESWLRPAARERHLATRARIILAGEEATVEEVAAQLGISDGLVTAWLGRYVAGGIDALRQSVRTPHTIGSSSGLSGG
ncbi:GntR family transcriptional regulator [Actinospica durhamensis]|uniref:GntR family transcriptional regulator n=1 Tax=Actinospica durhamensis TaxID=1508375 RepID=A0A941ESP9_9ACTN|nr:GntR family transcriptional regulator [Actinospica durhamensis]MBR7836611.1 GntR family transcriptional regulator [Actinospica durhamensis]